MAKPTRIYLGQAADPATRTCDWCGRPGVKAVEIFKPRKKIGTGQFLYPCARHVETARRVVESVKNPPKAA